MILILCYGQLNLSWLYFLYVIMVVKRVSEGLNISVFIAEPKHLMLHGVCNKHGKFCREGVVMKGRIWQVSWLSGEHITRQWSCERSPTNVWRVTWPRVTPRHHATDQSISAECLSLMPPTAPSSTPWFMRTRHSTLQLFRSNVVTFAGCSSC